MEKAVKRIHEVFVEHAADSPRLQAVRSGGRTELDLQLDVYRRASRSVKAVSRRAKQIDSFFP